MSGLWAFLVPGGGEAATALYDSFDKRANGPSVDSARSTTRLSASLEASGRARGRDVHFAGRNGLERALH